MQSVFKDRGRLKALCDERRRTFWDKSLLSEGGSSYSKPNTDRDSNLPKCSLHSLCIVKNILSVYNLFVSGQLYRESATTNNVYKRDPNEENWWKGTWQIFYSEILLSSALKHAGEGEAIQVWLFRYLWHQRTLTAVEHELIFTWLPSPLSMKCKLSRGWDTSGVRHSSGVPLKDNTKNVSIEWLPMKRNEARVEWLSQEYTTM